MSSAKQGDIIEMGMEAIHFGNTSLTLKCEVRNKLTRKTILIVDKIVFVSLNEEGNPARHSKTKTSYVKDRFEDS